MNNFINSFVGHSEGAVNVLMYQWDKTFKKGDKIKIRLSSQMKLTRVSYSWGDGERHDTNIFLKHSWFKVCVPEFTDLPLELKVFSEVQFSDGEKREHVHTFNVNYMK